MEGNVDSLQNGKSRDHDRLVRIEANQGWIMEQLSNHLAHHDKYLYWVVGAMGSIGIGLILNAILGG